MTDVVVQNLVDNKKVRIKCRDLVKKIAIYKNQLAVSYLLVFKLFVKCHNHFTLFFQKKSRTFYNSYDRIIYSMY